jgi:thiol-disulfide isomerase/thioredoxin
MNKKALFLIIFLLLVVVILAVLKWQGRGNSPTPIVNPPPSIEVTPIPSVSEVSPTKILGHGVTIGNFTITSNPICLEKDRPVIYYFGSNTCPHCQWEHPIIKKATDKFSGLISFHDNMDSQNDLEIFTKYNDIHSGYIPFLVFGCKYVRLGSGENVGEEIEMENLSVILCKLTNDRPASVCGPLKEKISEIK